MCVIFSRELGCISLYNIWLSLFNGFRVDVACLSGLCYGVLFLLGSTVADHHLITQVVFSIDTDILVGVFGARFEAVVLF